MNSLVMNGALAGGLVGWIGGHFIIKRSKSFVRQKYRHCPLIFYDEWEGYHLSKGTRESAVFYLEAIDNDQCCLSPLSYFISGSMPTSIDANLFRMKAIDALKNKNYGSQLSRITEHIDCRLAELFFAKPGTDIEKQLTRINNSFKTMTWWEKLSWDWCVEDYRILRYPEPRHSS